MNQNKIILKILKRPIKIHKYLNLLNNTVLENTNHGMIQNSLELNYFHLEENIRTVEVNDHAVKRWNERVGPYLTKRSIEGIFYNLFMMPHRIKKVKEGIGIIDSDIIFTYEKSDTNIDITTFYGRCSQNHTLFQFEALRRYNNFHDEKIMLNLEEEVLKTQNSPIIPKIFIEFSGSRTNYLLEGYEISNKKLPCVVVYSNLGRVTKIDLNNQTNQHINKSVLLALFVMHYRDFVWDYLKIKYNERVTRLEYK